jgi:hypothetical protein
MLKHFVNNPRTPILSLVGLLAGMAVRANDTVPPADVRKAVERSSSYLTKEGVS